MKPMGIHPGGLIYTPGGSFWAGHGVGSSRTHAGVCVCVCVRALTGYLWVSDVSLFLALLDIFMAVW